MEVHDLNLRHLRAFVKTYELGSILAASKSVNITQPAVTQGMARLEKSLGTQLFDRQPDGTKPTTAAQLFYPRVVAALKSIRNRHATHTQIRAFLALARQGSYVQASSATGLARPSLHRAVTDLEKILGQKLVSRKGRALELTAHGQTTARRMNLAQVELRSGIDEIDALTREGAGRIAVGAMPLCRASILPNTVVSFKECFPSSDILIVEGSHSELIDPLRDGEIDLMIGAMRMPSLGRDLVQEPLFEDQPVIVASKDHPLKKCHDEIPLDQLLEYKWCIPREGVPLRDKWLDLFEAAGHPLPQVSVECGSGLAIRQILMKTDYLSLFSPEQVALELASGWLKVVGRTPASMRRTIGMTYRHDWHPTHLQKQFMQSLKQNSENAGLIPIN